MRFLTISSITALTLVAAGADAQTMKPGLWDVTTTMGGSVEMDKTMAQMQVQLAAMPPAQRKQMEDMMTKQGIGLSGAPGAGMSARICITKEMAERNQVPMQQRGNCISTTSDKTAGSMNMKFTCTNPPSNGDGQFTFSGDTAYTMKMNVSRAVQGAPKTTTIDSSGKWAGANCGAVKPITVPPAAK